MTIINLCLARDGVDVVSDTLSTTLALEPVGVASKVLTLPHVPALVGVSSAGMLTAEVYRFAIAQRFAGGVEELARRLADALPRMQERLAPVCGAEVVRQGVVLLAGWAPALGRFAAYRLASWTAVSWAPEGLAEGAHLEPNIVENLEDVRGLRDLIAVAELQHRTLPGKSGGLLFHHRLDRDGITIRPVGELPEVAREAQAA